MAISNITPLLFGMSHIRFKRGCIVHPNLNITTKRNTVVLPRIIREDTDAGIHLVTFKNIEGEYLYDLYKPIRSAGCRIYINGNNDVTYKTANNSYPLNIYKIDKYENSDSISINSFNSILDMVVINGKTNISGYYQNIDGYQPDINNPLNFNSLYHLNLSNDRNDVVNINFKKEIRSLGNIHDTLVLDFINNRYHIVHTIGLKVLSGNDDGIIKSEMASDSHYSVFFIPDHNIKYNEGKQVICTHFESVTFKEMMNKEIQKNCICISNDMIRRENGIWVKISTEIANTLEEFKKLIYNIYKQNSCKILYQLSNPSFEFIYLDSDYKLPTYYDNTIIYNNSDCEVSYFYKHM